MDQPKKLTTAGPAVEAREQAKAYNSLFANQKIILDDGTELEIPPHPDFQMLDDDRQEAFEELLFEVESYDREPDIFIPEHFRKDRDGNDTGPLQPAETIRGRLLNPLRKDGVLMKPPLVVRKVIAAIGEAKYAQLKAGGRCAADVWRVWSVQGMEVRARQAIDSKSNGSSVDMVSVS